MRDKNKSNVFITGGNGFVGANIIRALLKDNYRVHVLNRSSQVGWRLKGIEKSLFIHQGDIKDYKTLRKIIVKVKPDYILHLAAYGAYSYQTEMDKIVDVNINGTKNLLEASKDIPYKAFINTGSSSEYGFKNIAMKEDDYCDPVSFYAATKLGQTHLCKVFAQQFDKPVLTLRLFSVYGPYEEPTRFVPAIMKALIKQHTIQLTPGKQRRDFVYVDDVIKVYLKAMAFAEKHSGKTFNVGTGEEYTNDEVVKTLFTVTKNKTIIEKGAYPKRSWDTTHWFADTENAKRQLHWTAQSSLDKGLKNTYDWFTNNMHFYK